MKKLIYIILALGVALGIASCSKKEGGRQKWQYRTLVAPGLNIGDFSQKPVNIPQAKLDSLGDEGWELVDVYTGIETVHPNFGNEKYVTGLQPNTRTADVYYVFKRPVDADDTAKYERVEYVPIVIETTVAAHDTI